MVVSDEGQHTDYEAIPERPTRGPQASSRFVIRLLNLPLRHQTNQLWTELTRGHSSLGATRSQFTIGQSGPRVL